MTETIITFDVDAFRVYFPQFADADAFSDDTLQMNWDISTDFVTNTNNTCYMSLSARTRALNLMTAHITALTVIIAAGGGGTLPSLEQAATIDKISVTVTPPPHENQWRFWLNLTPYGQQLLVLLSLKSVGGYYVGGCPVLPAFRR